jgi:hypothetical protein
MVEVTFNSYKIIPYYCNNRFELHMHTSTISVLIFNTSPIIKTPYSWLFHIIRIYTLKYILKTLKTRLQFILSYYDITKNSRNNINIEFIIEVSASLCY